MAIVNIIGERAMFGAGCFWGVEEDFRQLPGVLATAVGYAGGHIKAPSYEQVCTATTGHAEVLEVVYDPTRITFESLLAHFFASHDPTQLNRQGPDIGSQYRSVIFALTQHQAEAAQTAISAENASGRYKKPLATTIESDATFYHAEDYHQQYVAKRQAARR